ncbi:MAG: glycosyltransferase [Chthoniobacterales bacterium]
MSPSNRGPVVFVQPFGLGSPGGGPRILRALLENAPLPWHSIGTSPEKLKPWPNETHVPSRPFWGGIEYSRLAFLPQRSSRFFAKRFRRRLERLCRRLGARALHAVPHSGLDFVVAQEVARALSVPFFISLHDDLDYTALGRESGPRLEAAMRSAWQEAAARFVISPALGREYCRRYGERPFLVVTDGVRRPGKLQPRPETHRLRIYFMGLFHLGYERNLVALLRAIELFEREHPHVCVTVTLRCEHVGAGVLKGLKPVTILPFSDEAQVQRDLEEADLLYLPLHFDAADAGFARYSLSTKMVTYAGSGLPILYHGPQESATFDLLQEYGAALPISTLIPAEIAAALGALTAEARESAARNALKLARAEFVLADQQRKFWSAITSALADTKAPLPDAPRHAPEKTPRGLRILAVVNLPWDPRLGATRVWIELAEQWRAAGHTVEKICLTDAYPQKTASPRLAAVRELLFARKAAAFVRAHGHNFDVIDALLGTLPYSKRRLCFRGLLVARSVGLYLRYERFAQSVARQTPRTARGTLRGRFFYRFLRRRTLRASDRAVRHADLINVPNEQESVSLREEIGRADGIVVLPYGLAPKTAHALAQAALSPAARLSQARVCVLGMWAPRKGAQDWPRIIRAVRAQAPQAKFRFLGTMVDPRVIPEALGQEAENIECISKYQPDELPSLLADCTVGAFPSYVEGFGLAVIEQLTAGLPTVAYDTAGPRDILRRHLGSLLVPCGQVEEFAATLLRLLSLEVEDYRQLSEKSRLAAAGFSWPEIAAETIALYRHGLENCSPDPA